MADVSRRLTCGAKRLAHLNDAQGVGGSNPTRPTTLTSGNSVLRAGARVLTLEEKVLYTRESRWAMSELRGSSPKGEFNPTIT